MRPYVSLSIALALLTAVVTVAGCAPAGDATPAVPGTSRAASATIPAGSGQVTEPSGAERAAIIQAAANGIGMKGSLTAVQVYVQDGNAVGDLRGEEGARELFALAGGPKAWRLVWSAPFGAKRATADSLAAQFDGSFKDLAAKLDFDLKVAANAPSGGPAPTLMCLVGYVRTTAAKSSDAAYTGTFDVNAKIGKDASGVYWGNATAEPEASGAVPVGVWAKWDGAAWTGKVAPDASGKPGAAYFPAEVISQLGL